MPRQLSLTELEEALFDPRKDPVLAPGFVTPEYTASEAELRTAAKLLVYRRQHYGWRLDPLPQAVVAAVEACLAAAAAGGMEAMAAPDSEAAEPAPNSKTADTAALLKHRIGLPLPWRPLPFYPEGRLIHVPAPEGASEPAAASERVLVFEGASGLGAHRLTGEALPMHNANEEAPFDPSPRGAVEEYVDFFCAHLHVGEGAFYIIEEGDYEAPGEESDPADSPGEILVPADRPLHHFYHVMRDYRRAGGISPRERARFGAVLEHGGGLRAQLAHPITRIGKQEPDSPYVLLATMLFGGAPFRAALAVQPSGNIEIIEDREIREAAIRPLAPPWLPRTPR